MSEHNTPEARAEKAYPMDHYTHQVQREAYAAALRDDAARDERTSENAKLRALVQVLVDGIETMKQGSFADQFIFASDAELSAHANRLIATAKEQGFVPTNTEDNG